MLRRIGHRQLGCETLEALFECLELPSYELRDLVKETVEPQRQGLLAASICETCSMTALLACVRRSEQHRRLAQLVILMGIESSKSFNFYYYDPLYDLLLIFDSHLNGLYPPSCLALCIYDNVRQPLSTSRAVRLVRGAFYGNACLLTSKLWCIR